MNVSKHAMRRYAERIARVSKEEVNRYVSVNETELFVNISTMFEHATFIWKGQLYDNITRNYYINKDIILVTNTDNSAIITLYRIDFGFPTHTNHIVISDLMEHIETLQADFKVAEETLNQEKNQLDADIDLMDRQIKIVTEQLENLRSQYKAKTEERRNLLNKNVFLSKEIERNAILLCNSLEYKNDLKELAR